MPIPGGIDPLWLPLILRDGSPERQSGLHVTDFIIPGCRVQHPRASPRCDAEFERRLASARVARSEAFLVGKFSPWNISRAGIYLDATVFHARTSEDIPFG